MADKPARPKTTLNDLIAERVSRRHFLSGAAATAIASSSGVTASTAQAAHHRSHRGKRSPSLQFNEIKHQFASSTVVADGYQSEVLLRWGDRLSGAEFKEPLPQTPDEQDRAFGSACDYIAYMPLPLGSDNSDHGLLCVNHEYPNAPGMFSGYTSRSQAAAAMPQSKIDQEMNAVGFSVVEVKRGEDGNWTYVADSRHNRRITPMTEMEMTGPAAGHRRLKTNEDPTGRRAIGTFGNCAGGRTPWGTVLSAEENVHPYFYGDLRQMPEDGQEELRNHHKMRVGKMSSLDDQGNPKPIGSPRVGWYRFHDRFDITKEPREANRFGYVVEIDPYDPNWTPKKRTALGRYAHECACVHAVEGKPVVVYSTDDAYNQFIYRFVSKGTYRATDRNANRDLLADGDLYVAKFNDNGTGQWIKIEFQEPWLVPKRSGLKDEAELYIETRLAADLLGATPMDRPEDIEVSPLTGRYYVTLTKDPRRKPNDVNAANPRPQNVAGHIIEFLPPGEDGDRDHWSNTFEWEIFLLAGDPTSWNPNFRGSYNRQISENGWFINPDNLAFDPSGRLWIGTDGFNENVDRLGGRAPVSDGLWACETTGPNRAKTQCFFLAPQGAECTGPTFTPDGKTLFVSVQHPGIGGGYNYDRPLHRWPDNDPNLPPRPSVVAITRKDGGKVGG